jgi:hypothetical protein
MQSLPAGRGARSRRSCVREIRNEDCPHLCTCAVQSLHVTSFHTLTSMPWMPHGSRRIAIFDRSTYTHHATRSSVIFFSRFLRKNHVFSLRAHGHARRCSTTSIATQDSAKPRGHRATRSTVSSARTVRTCLFAPTACNKPSQTTRAIHGLPWHFHSLAPSRLSSARQIWRLRHN